MQGIEPKTGPANTACPLCEGDTERQIDCLLCAGSGVQYQWAYAVEPFSRITDNLWMGGTGYCKPEDPENKVWPVTTQMLAQGQFDKVFCFTRPPSECLPPQGVRWHQHRFWDGDLDPEEFAQVHRIARLVANELLDGKKVLVQCRGGMNRSGLVAALALHDIGLTPAAAIERVRAGRHPLALFNQRFVDYILNHQCVFGE